MSQDFVSLSLSERAPVTLCVVIPAFNEEALIGRCIASVLRAGIAADNVFVIDDCSSDRTGEVASQFEGVHVARNPQNLGKARSLRRLIDLFQLPKQFACIALLDADSYVAEGYFDAVQQAFADNPDAVLVCGKPHSERHNWLTAFRTLEYAIGGWVYREGQDFIGAITVAPGCASTYRSEIIGVLDWNGGTLVEDMDLTVQIHRKRLGRIRYAKAAVTFTQDPKRLRDYIGQITRWYSGTWQVMRRHGLPFGRQRIDVELGCLVGEGLVYSGLVMLLPIFAFLWPDIVLRWLLLDQAVTIAVAALVAVRLARPDVLFWAPLYSVVRVLNCAMWLRTFWLEIVRRRTLTVWFSVARYEMAGDRRA